MGSLVASFVFVLGVLRKLVFVAALVVAAGALLSYALRTRKIPPFSSLARLARRADSVLFAPMEHRILRAGGSPASAPWWTLAVVVVGGLILLSVVEFLLGQALMLAAALTGGRVSLVGLILSWTFGFLRIAIIARVIASWVGGSPYSKWWRWSFASTEWFMAPLRRIVPTLGRIDISPLVAYFGIGVLQSLVFTVLLNGR